MKRFTVLLVACLLFASIASAHDGYHYAGIAGTAPSTDTTIATMMMPHKPTNCPSGDCHVIGWTVLWDAYATGQYVEAGIGYNRNKSKHVTLWWASPQHETMKKVATVPYGTWVLVAIYKPLGQEHAEVRWRWIDAQGVLQEIIKLIDTPGWLGNMAYHPTKAEVYTENGHPGNVELHFNGVWQWPGDQLYWHVEGKWAPEGTFAEFVVR